MQAVDAFLRFVQQQEFNGPSIAQPGADKVTQLRFSIDRFGPLHQEAGKVSSGL